MLGGREIIIAQEAGARAVRSYEDYPGALAFWEFFCKFVKI